jgi:hypothetical protein
MKSTELRKKKIILIVLSVLILATWGAVIYYANNTGADDPDTVSDSVTSEITSQTTHVATVTETNASTGQTTATEATTESVTSETTSAAEPITDETLQEFRVNEVGQVYVLMFHGFIPDDKAETYSDKEYTMTFTQFRETLQTLYDKDYRPITMDEFLEGRIDVPLGKIPVVLTFDDGRSGQFNLIEKDGEYVVNPESAVGIWMDFNKDHPDFGLKGTFYINLGDSTFDGGAELSYRLKYLIGLGFEIGNHTYTHGALRLITNADDLLYQIGKNQEVMESLVPGYKFSSLALPFGEDVTVDTLRDTVVSGEYNGTEYFNKGVLDCKWRPSYSPFSVDYSARSIYRVRADGLKHVDCDMSDWMLNKIPTKIGQFISDGDPDTVTVPASLADELDSDSVGGREIVTYILD